MAVLADMRDLSFLEFKDEDSEHIRDLKSYWQMVMAMPEDERKYFLQEERVRDEESHLAWMVDSSRSDADWVEYAVSMGKRAMLNYQETKDEQQLEIAELWAEAAQGTKGNRYTIADIRKQRERIQWQKKQLSQMTKPSTESSQS